MIVGLILPADHPWRDEAPMLGTVAFDGEISGLSGAARARIDVLLLDVTDLDSADLAAIRSYRIARPGTRMVVSLPVDGPAGQPGSPVLAGFVGMGVYDLTQGVSLQDALMRTPTYADAVRWTMAGDQDSGVGRRIEVRERIVERRIAASQRSVFVVVAGMGYGVGTTTLARLVAETAREQGQVTTLIDAAIMPGASRLHGPVTVLRAVPRGSHLPSFEIEAALQGQSGGYVVVDAGRAGESAGLAELARTADAVLLAVPPAVHRLAWAEALAEEPLVPRPTAYVVVGGSEALAAAMAAELGQILHEKAGPVHHLPHERPERAITAILGERLLPKGRRPSLLSRVRWRARTFAALPGGVLRLVATVAQQAAFVIGRLLGLVIVATALAVVAAVVLPAFGGVHAVAHVFAWAHAQWRQISESLP